MTRVEFIKRKINSTNNNISQAKAQLVADAHKPTVSKSLLGFIDQCQAKLVRYDMGILDEGEEFHLSTIK